MDTRRQELAEFLQAMRQRGSPEAFGFPSGSRRRTQGLRREEVAQLAGISATWYTWIEQAREVNVSPDALDRLATALKLSKSERSYLFDMADRRDPQGQQSEVDTAPDTLVTMLSQMQLPAYIMGRTWDILAWNPAAEDLFSGLLDIPWTDATRPNLMRFVFMSPIARLFVVNWEMRARRLVAEFRADCRSRLEEAEIKQLVIELSSSAEFSQFWKQHDVLERQGGLRAFQHPIHGLIQFQQVTLRPVEQEQLKLVLLQPLA
ncbi:helix-turn-helix transcriptional regulator [Methylophilus medardicus]|uniref:Helix-turn-helix domain-containing protein n=1 Tax=Methylophilus medardicus TaxID=2588534 RepID=A0A5B8CSG9_9PROT|nr:helix-turn-helix transcriptional regulator [Methylophilus medardicus]QDC44252.1 helix-turn-helix domain-containing protein [Methylophilus medardicus]QDC49259.1 helix-turn-helix domain-containing protein [Methylophilus medardicus]QDC52964.1 helix-turn-helix domain-containing protein [Methylophilus medardicus]